MFKILENEKSIKAAQRKLERNLRASIPSQGKGFIGYRGGNVEHELLSAGEDELYCAFSLPEQDTTPRYWNSFGRYREQSRSQQIIVEINIPLSGETERVGGFFAKDTETSKTYLMHTGKIGGGREGIGKRAFLDFLCVPDVETIANQRSRQGIPIGNLDDKNLVALIWSFVQKVEEFKQNVATNPAIHSASKTYGTDNGYSPEFSGRKKGKTKGAFDYFSYHGMIVEALKRDREQTLGAVESLNTNQLIDLYVTNGAARTEVYEVKNSNDRQSFYTALGQLETHAPNPSTKKFLVMPSIEKLDKDCTNALDRLGIEKLGFELMGSGSTANVVFIRKSK